jgi:hypothetical protein
MLSPNVINPITKKESHTFGAAFVFRRDGEMTITLCYLVVISFVIKNCTAILLTEIKVGNYF